VEKWRSNEENNIIEGKEEWGGLWTIKKIEQKSTLSARSENVLSACCCRST